LLALLFWRCSEAAGPLNFVSAFYLAQRLQCGGLPPLFAITLSRYTPIGFSTKSDRSNSASRKLAVEKAGHGRMVQL
jgi:hypothetical protein